jgi:filamentous hemagglutinin family protein
MSAAIAGPQGGTVVFGNVTISRPTQLRTVIQQSSLQGIINWQTFSNSPKEAIVIQQPAATAVTLNRVTTTNPSFILGSLQANGRVFVVNPSGIIFGPNAQVNVGSLVATTANLSDSNFKNGNYQLDASGSFKGSVVNYGSITAAPGGTVALVSPLVHNQGKITAPGGRVILGATSGAVVSFDGQGYISGGANKDALRVPRESFSPFLEQVVNTSQEAVAHQVQRLPDGTVILVGASELAVHEGQINVDGNAARPAGRVIVNGAHQVVFGAGSSISAKGLVVSSGDGSVQVNGNLRVNYDRLPTSSAAPSKIDASGYIHVQTDGGVGAGDNKALQLSAPSVNLVAKDFGIGTPGAPIVVNTSHLNAFSSNGDLYFESTGNIGIDSLQALPNDSQVVVTSGGAITANSTTPPHIRGSFVTLTAQTGIGTASAPLILESAGGAFTANTQTGTVHVQASNYAGPARGNGQQTATVILFRQPRPQPYTVPTDPADPSGGSSSADTLGNPDNVLLPALRQTLAKSDERSDQTEGADGLVHVVKVTSDDPGSAADDDEKKSKHNP